MPMNMPIDERASEELADRVCEVINEATAGMDEAEACEFGAELMLSMAGTFAARRVEIEKHTAIKKLREADA